MSVLDTLKSLIGRANKDIEENLSKEAESVEEAADAIQTSSEEEIETKSDSETISEEEAAEEVAEAEEEVEAEEAPVEEEAVEEAVEEVPEEEVSLDNAEESIDDKLSEDEAPEEAVEVAVEEEASEENEESDNMTLLKENDIYSMDDIDKEFTQKFVDAGIETVDHCFQCGTCGGGCPSGRRTPYRVRQIVRKCHICNIGGKLNELSVHSASAADGKSCRASRRKIRKA